MNDACENTDKEIWREKPGDYYSDSIHVTETGSIGIDCGGHVIVAPLKTWFSSMDLLFTDGSKKSEWKRKIAMWLLTSNKKNRKFPMQ